MNSEKFYDICMRITIIIMFLAITMMAGFVILMMLKFIKC